MLAGNESRKAIEQAVGSIEKQFGKANLDAIRNAK